MALSGLSMGLIVRRMLQRDVVRKRGFFSTGSDRFLGAGSLRDHEACLNDDREGYDGVSRLTSRRVSSTLQQRRRDFSVNVQTVQNSLEASEPAPGLQAAASLRNYVGSLSPGFSVLPHPPSGLAAALTSPSHVGRLSLEVLGREMSICLSHGRLEEAVQLFDNWVRFPDLEGKPKLPNVMVYNLLLHAKLRLGTDPSNMLQIVKEMEMSGVKPNLLTYNFLLRAIFRQRDSTMAERILQKMEQSGPEAQPDGDSYNFTIVLCALDRRLNPAMKHLQAMYDRGYVPSKTTYNELLRAATRLLHTRVGVVIMKDLKKQNIVPQLQTMIEMALAAAEVDDSECALLALQSITQTELNKILRASWMDEGGMNALLATAARSADMALSEECWTILRNSLRSSKAPSPCTFLARIHACAAAGDLTAAFACVRELEAVYGNSQNGDEREVLSPFSSLRPLVLACTRGGFSALDAVRDRCSTPLCILTDCLNERPLQHLLQFSGLTSCGLAYYKLAEMQTSGHPVAVSAINCVIQGCSNSWDVDRAYQTFEEIGKTFGLQPNVHSCNSLLDVFGKTSKTTEVQQIFKYMEDTGVIPDHRTYSLMVDAHVINRDTEAAMTTLNSMMNAGHTPQRDTPYKVWRRCTREDNHEGAMKMDELLIQLGYRNGNVGAGKWRAIGVQL